MFEWEEINRIDAQTLLTLLIVNSIYLRYYLINLYNQFLISLLKATRKKIEDAN